MIPVAPPLIESLEATRTRLVKTVVPQLFL